MSTKEDLILEHLNNLNEENFKRFKDCLCSINYKDKKNPPICSLENADRVDTREILREFYSEDAADVTIIVLRKINCNDSANKLQQGLKRKAETQDEPDQGSKHVKLSTSITDPSDTNQVDGPFLTEYSLSQMEEFASKNRRSLIEKLKKRLGTPEVEVKKQLLKSMKLKENWLLNWKKAKEISGKLYASQKFHWSLLEEQLFEKVNKSKTTLSLHKQDATVSPNHEQHTSRIQQTKGFMSDRELETIQHKYDKKEDVCAFTEQKTEFNKSLNSNTSLISRDVTLETCEPEDSGFCSSSNNCSILNDSHCAENDTGNITPINQDQSKGKPDVPEYRIIASLRKALCLKDGEASFSRPSTVSDLFQKEGEIYVEKEEVNDKQSSIKGQNNVYSVQGHNQHTFIEQEEKIIESPARIKRPRKYKNKAEENERKEIQFTKWLEWEVEKVAKVRKTEKKEIKDEIQSSIEFIDTREHKTCRCLAVHNCILYTSIINREKRLIQLENTLSECLTNKRKQPREEFRFKWQYYMWMFGGIKKTDVVFCDRDSDKIKQYKYEDTWFKNFHTRFPLFLDEEVLPVIALYKEAQQENKFRFLKNEMQ